MSFGAGLWRLADPKISLASFASLFVGACAAAAEGPLAMDWLALTVAGIFALEVAKNASGDVFDFDSGADLLVEPGDRSPFSGGKRVLVDGLLTRSQTWGIAVAGYVSAAAIGGVIALAREPRILALAAAGGALAFFYHAPPLRLSYRGAGEAAVALCYGPGIAAGTYLVQRGEWSAVPVWVATPLGLLVGAFLWINEFPDFHADSASGKRTWVVRLGRRRAAIAYAWIVATAFVLLLALPAICGVSRAVWLGLAGAPWAVRSVRRLLASPETTPRVVAGQADGLAAFVAYALGAGVGRLVGR